MFQPVNVNQYSIGTGLSLNHHLTDKLVLSFPLNIYYQKNFNLFYNQHKYFGINLNANMKYVVLQKKRINAGIGLNFRKNYIQHIYTEDIYLANQMNYNHIKKFNNDRSYYPELINYLDYKSKKILFRTNFYFGLKYDNFYQKMNSRWLVELEIKKISKKIN